MDESLSYNEVEIERDLIFFRVFVVRIMERFGIDYAFAADLARAIDILVFGELSKYNSGSVLQCLSGHISDRESGV